MAKQATRSEGTAPPGPYAVILDKSGDKKIQVIKVVRELTSLGLKEAKNLVDEPPQTIVSTTEEFAAEAVRQLEAAGGTARVNLGGAPVVVQASPDGSTFSVGRCPHCRALTTGTRCNNCGAPL